MRTSLTIVLTGVFLLFINCNAPSELNKENTETNIENVTKSSLDIEAEATAKPELYKMITKCDDSYYAFSRYKGIIELKDHKVVSFPKEITEADKLNKVTWKGEIRLLTKIFREYDMSKYDWADWEDGEQYASLNLEKRDNQWLLKSPPKPTVLKCSEMPFNNIAKLKRQDNEAQELLDGKVSSSFTKCGDYYVAMFFDQYPYRTKQLNFRAIREKRFYRNEYRGWISSKGEKFNGKWISHQSGPTRGGWIRKTVDKDWEIVYDYTKASCT